MPTQLSASSTSASPPPPCLLCFCISLELHTHTTHTDKQTNYVLIWIRILMRITLTKKIHWSANVTLSPALPPHTVCLSLTLSLSRVLLPWLFNCVSQGIQSARERVVERGEEEGRRRRTSTLSLSLYSPLSLCVFSSLFQCLPLSLSLFLCVFPVSFSVSLPLCYSLYISPTPSLPRPSLQFIWAYAVDTQLIYQDMAQCVEN